MVSLWPITKPAYLIENFPTFDKASGHDAIENVFPVVALLWHVYIVAGVKARGRRGIPLVIFLWEVFVVTVMNRDRGAMKAR